MFVSLDLETTGLDKKTNEITEFGAIKFDLEGNIETFQTLINPGVKIPEFITYITNIRNEDVADAPSFEATKDQITKFIGDDPIVGHFISFDTDFLKEKGLKLKNPLYDTAELSRIFLPGLPSYSLEVLSDLLEIEHVAKHRALDDAIAAQQLFLKLIEKIQTSDPKLLEEIKQLSSKSSWYFAEVLQTLESKPASTTSSETKPEKSQTQKEELSTPEQEAVELLSKQSKTSIIECPLITESLISKIRTEEKSAVILCPRELIQEVKSHKIYPANNYISETRLAKYKKQESFSTPEITAIIKVMIWLESTETGILTENLQFSPDEYNILTHIKTLDAESLTERTALENSEESLIAPYSYRPTTQKEHLIIIDSTKFIKDLYYQNSQTILLKKIIEPLKALSKLTDSETTKELIEKSEVMFALLEKTAESSFSANYFQYEATVSNFDIASKGWALAKETAQSLIVTSNDLKDITNESTLPYLKIWKETLKDIEKIVINPDLENFILVYQKTRQGDLLVKNVPISVHESFAELQETAKKITIITPASNALDDSRYIKKTLGLNKAIETHSIKPNTEQTDIFITNDIRGGTKDISIRTNEFLKKFLQKEKGRTLMIVNSIRALDEIHTVLAPKLKKEGITLLAQKGSGGIGKILELYKKDPENTAILLTPNNWERFNAKDLETSQDFKNIIIQKIPFDPPSETTLNAISRNFSDPWIEVSIPRAILSLKTVINKFLAASSGQMIVLDSRLIEKPYTKPFLETLKTYGNVSDVSSDFLC